MLDWIAERKAAHDLVSSIKDGRYERQKIQISRCGLSELICHAIHINSDSDANNVVLQARSTCWTGSQSARQRTIS
jgi:hypothetical protein